MESKRIVVKVGTNVLTQESGLLDMTAISHLVDQLVRLKQKGYSVILVSSGAVGAGRSMLEVSDKVSKVVRRQVYSAVGQVRLMETYRQLFANYDLFCAQVLATKEDFRDRLHYINMRNCFQALLRDAVIPIVNENDVIAIEELMFTDNDELAGLVAAMMNANTLIILSNVDGVYDGPPGEKGSSLIHEIDIADKRKVPIITTSRSTFGRGGMQTKFRIASKASRVGIATYIANGKRRNILTDIINNTFVGTYFKPKPGLVSNRKKWMAYTEETDKGIVRVNTGAQEALCKKDQASSLLPIGITAVIGDFQKGDLIQIQSQSGVFLGLGIAQYGASTARNYLGVKGKKPLIHYDYLFIENI